MNAPKIITLFLITVLYIACGSDDVAISSTPTETPIVVESSPNILLIIADDMGLDATPGYDIGTIKPNMPNLQNMINSGVRFTNLWSNPTCTPTRSSIITGKYGFRTNVLNVGDVLSTSETSLQQFLTTNSPEYKTAVIGKWHLSTSPTHPTDMGIDYYAGLLSGGVQSYWNWNLTENQQTANSTEYTTTKFTDLAIDWVSNQTDPWFLWLAYNAPHTPFHLPPNELHSQGNLPDDTASIDANPIPYYMAMLEAMDSEIGRLLSSMSTEERENTVIIFIGDNGTPNQVVQEYISQRAKGTLYQGGINVPMIVSGKNVTRFNDTEEALVNTTDLFATIADIAATGTSEVNDSQSFKTLLSTTNTETRDYVYAEISSTGGSNYTIRNATHKYILFDNGTEAFYDLSVNPFENPNLLSANQLPLNATDSAIKDELVNRLNEIRQ
ncbi:sulfatase-like hydrolase/transferase [Kordia sp. YSTF-M3]|uniref:Sulfatase-like hydrolase/transferase n=1 Tax=Kordia aestuariivivens TaxID=2759037 RepID=A0ABR7QEL5_9FLAO|nr:sulfatase-like hydrolase/transferase [Kordia aestuariivivens]MBC8757019.1 sulfatase-like hydrolase/transferase [Kordia aestuariivivens]